MTFQNSQIRFYISLIRSGEGRHTTHLLKCILLFSTSQTDCKQSSDVLSDISFDILSDMSSDILSDISKTKHSIHSFTQKPLHKRYIYLTPRSKSNIHDNFVCVKWQFYSCIRLHRTAPPRSSWVQRRKAPVATHTHHMHQTAPPKKQLSPKMPCKWAHRRNYISWRVQTMKSDPCHCGSCLSFV